MTTARLGQRRRVERARHGLFPPAERVGCYLVGRQHSGSGLWAPMRTGPHRLERSNRSVQDHPIWVTPPPFDPSLIVLR